MNNKEVISRCTGELLDRAAELFGVTGVNLEFIEISENVVYSYLLNGSRHILRLTHRGGRSVKQVKAELEWVQYLHRKGAPVHNPVLSVNGQLTETLKTPDINFIVTSFEWLDGRVLPDEELTDKFIGRWGQAIGKLHSLTKCYNPASSDYKRFEWYEDHDLINRHKYVPPGHKLVLEKFDILVGKLKKLPINRDCYGLIHSDVHNENFFFHDGEIALFDFDDCFYTWFSLDFATVWYCALYMDQGDGNRSKFLKHFEKVFFTGYNKENDIDSFWVDQIPLFLQYQEMLLYIYFYRIHDENDLTEKQKSLISRYRNRIENDILYFGRLE